MLAKKHDISIRSLRTIIKDVPGMAVNQFIGKVLEQFIVHGTDDEISRVKDIERAKIILQQNDINISEIELERLVSSYPHS